MKKYLFKNFLAFSLCVTFVPPAHASFWTNWTEDPADPIYKPYPNPTNTVEDYYPFVVYDADKFDGNNVSGDPAYLYKMWHQGPNGIALSYSNDGIAWVLKGQTNLIPPFAPSRPTHPVVLYNINGFTGAPDSSYKYRIWYWQGFNTNCTPTTLPKLLYSFSQDGFTWLAPLPSFQNPLEPICFGVGLFGLNGGPGFVIYNPNPTSISGQPFTFPYAMYFDAARTVATNFERIGLATSPDGITWSLVGNTPVLEPGPTAWDSAYVFGARIIKAGKTYHMFYTGSNNVGGGTTAPYAHGIGHASSTDGINWVKDPDNPIFIVTDGVPWRTGRTWAPIVLFGEFCANAGQCPTCFAKMWFSGGTGASTGINQGIGYATLQCPQCSITLSATPTFVFLGTPVTLTATMSGVAPFDLVWSDGFTQTDVSSPATRIVTPQVTTTYSVSSTDANGCQATSNDVTVEVIVGPLSCISAAILEKYCP